MSITARIRANGGDLTRDEWRFRFRPGRLKPEAIAWARANYRTACREIWPLFDLWEERAAIREYDGNMTRAEAEARAYEDVST